MSNKKDIKDVIMDENKRKTILLTEIGALIHDIGKLSEEFVKKQSIEEGDNFNNFHHGKIIDYDIEGRYSAQRDVGLQKLARDLKNKLNHKIEINNKSATLNKIIKEHHNSNNKKIIKLIKNIDKYEAGEDRGGAKDSQSICKTYRSSAFGHETELNIGSLTEERKKAYRLIIDHLEQYNSEKDINTLIEKRSEFLEKLKSIFLKTLGMTARGANDVTLWDHSWMSATLAKAAVIDCLKSRKAPENKGDIEFKIFAIGWDYFEFLNQSQKITDVTGRIGILKEIKDEIRTIIEEKYLAGNQVYEDDQGIYFVVPSSFDKNVKNELKKEIYDVFNRRLKGIIWPCFKTSEEINTITEITNVRKGLLEKIDSSEKEFLKKIPPKWIDNWGKEKVLCQHCKKLPANTKKDDICKLCNDLREKGRNQKNTIQSKFIDKIAWSNDKKDYQNVALITASFDLGGWLDGEYVASFYIRNPFDYKKEIIELGDYLIFDQNEKKLKGIFSLIKSLSNMAKKYSNSGQESIKNGIKKQLENLEERKETDIQFLIKKIREELPKNEFLNEDDFIKSISPYSEDINKTMHKLQKIKINSSELDDIFPKAEKANKITKFLWGKEDLNLAREIYKKCKHPYDPIDFYQNLVTKNASASRLFRVWNDTKKFFEDFESDICETVDIVYEPIIELDEDVDKIFGKDAGTLKFKIIQNDTKNRKNRVQVEGIKHRGDPNKIEIVTPHLNEYIFERKNIKFERNRKFYDAKVLKNYKRVKQYRKISVSPNLFQFIVPADKSLEIIKMFEEKYQEHFGKVYGKLPLSVGTVYFKRKEPIFVVLDAARRFNHMFRDDGKENEEKESEEKRDGQKFIITDVDNYDGKLKLNLADLDNKSRELNVNIGLDRGDGEIDFYHPYIPVVEAKSQNKISFKSKENLKEQVHLSEIKNDDQIKIHPNHFDFEFLDTSSKRFNIIKNGNQNRKHSLFGQNDPRPYYMEEIRNIESLKNYLMKTENEFKKKCTPSQLHNFKTIVASRVEDWEGNNELVENFVEDSIVNILGIKKRIKKENGEKKENPDFEFVKNSVLSGMFFDMMELYHSIIKNLKEED